MMATRWYLYIHCKSWFFHFSQISQGMSRLPETASYRWCVRIKGLIKEGDPISASAKAEVAGWISLLPLNLQTSFASRHRGNKVLLVWLLAKITYCKLLTLRMNYVVLAGTSYRSGNENGAVWSILKELRMIPCEKELHVLSSRLF